jgi:hypothetical protein
MEFGDGVPIPFGQHRRMAESLLHVEFMVRLRVRSGITFDRSAWPVRQTGCRPPFDFFFANIRS